MPKKRRGPLTRERVLLAALEIADAGGFHSLSMRRVAAKLGVEAMSLYTHIAGKEDIVDGLVDIVFGEIEVPEPGSLDWRTAMRRRAISVRAALNRHRWAVGLMEGRMNPGRANVANHDAVMGCLREGGFAFRGAVHAYSVLDAYVYGFALQERGLPFDTAEETADVMRRQRETVGFSMDDYPYLVETATELEKAGYDYDTEFLFGLDLVLDGLERYKAQAEAERESSGQGPAAAGAHH
jgi:AcrR family transcriptional regulator